MTESVCSIEGCTKPCKTGKTKGWCSMHYTRWYRHGDTTTVLPKSPPPTMFGPRKPRVPCKVDGCDRNAVGRGWCTKHYQHWYSYGDPVKPAPRTRPPRTHCKYGHPLSGDNVRVLPRSDAAPRRVCRACQVRNSKAYRARHPRATRPGPPCSVDGCTTTARSRGWCPKHYARWRIHGDPHTTLLPRRTRPT